MAIVVITGASSGIGEAAARALAERGHRLVLAARRVDRLQALAAELGARTEVVVVPTDVADRAQVEALARRAGEHFGGIDVWINNAGIAHRHPWWELSPEAIDRVIDVNLRAAIHGARAAIPWMLRQRRGHIINVASVSGLVGVSGVYSATKFGLRGHSEALRRELAPYGIHVSLVSPGFVRTEMTANNPMPMPPASVVGKVIANLIDRPRREVVVPGWYRLAVWLNAAAPWLVDRALSGRLGRLRSGSHGTAVSPAAGEDRAER